ncbi:hypothetical protein E2C01_025687 [Portunus trituberculatus]|uniref:Secreted protein n=1 Tax=Portunus trituberculatus TaxID=210409 RepID=A0A5B7EGD6_PORTR|nr:hypothetical protein [Portunus trituberculatus]
MGVIATRAWLLLALTHSPPCFPATLACPATLSIPATLTHLLSSALALFSPHATQLCLHWSAILICFSALTLPSSSSFACTSFRLATLSFLIQRVENCLVLAGGLARRWPHSRKSHAGILTDPLGVGAKPETLPARLRRVSRRRVFGKSFFRVLCER